MHYLYCTKDLLNSDTGSRLLLHILFYLPCCYRVLELIYRVLPTKPAFTGWSGTCNCRVTASLHSPTNSDSFPCAMAIGRHKKSFFSHRHLSDWVGHDLRIATSGWVRKSPRKKTTVTCLTERRLLWGRVMSLSLDSWSLLAAMQLADNAKANLCLSLWTSWVRLILTDLNKTSCCNWKMWVNCIFVL